MKTFLKILIGAFLLSPTLAFANITVPFTATSTDWGFLAPNAVNGNFDGLLIGATTTIPNIKPQSGTLLYILENGLNARITSDTYANTVTGSIFQGRKARGTSVAPSTPLSGDTLALIGGDGYGTTGFHNVSLGAISVTASGGPFTDTSAATDIKFFTSATTTIAATQRMILDSNGNLGVGLTTPGFARLEVQGTTTDSTANAFTAWDSSGKNVFQIANNGNTYIQGSVGIGTSSPTAQFDSETNSNSNFVLGNFRNYSNGTAAIATFNVVNDTGAQFGLQMYGSGSTLQQNSYGTPFNLTNMARLRASLATNGLVIGTGSAQPVVFITNDTEAMRITSAGNLAIGNISPWTKLSVTGGLGVTGSSTIGDGTQAGGLTISGGATTTGNVNIKTITNTTLGSLDVAKTGGGIQYPLILENNNANGTAQDTGICFRIQGTEQNRCKGAIVYDSNASATFNTGDFLFLQNSAGDTSNPTLANTVLDIKNSGLIGIGTTSPFAKLSVQANAVDTNQAVFAVGSSTPTATSTIFAVERSGQQTTGVTTKPTLATCGTTNNVSGTDVAGTIQFTGTLVTACTLNFASPIPATENVQCQATTNSSSDFAFVSATSSTAVTFGTSASLSTGTIYYRCDNTVKN